ncbi:MAG: TlpA family protein disulfide reductase [Smithellaceae bacterium]
MITLSKLDSSGIEQRGSAFRRIESVCVREILRIIMRYAFCYVLASGLLLYCASGSFAQGIFSSSNAQTDVAYASDFVLKDLNSKDIKLSDYKGKVILLNFMTTWCPNCLASIPKLKAMHARYFEKGLIIININIQETPRLMVAYSKKHNLPYSTLLDPEGTISKSYGVLGVPVMVLIDRDGRIICWNCRSLDNLLEGKFQ